MPTTPNADVTALNREAVALCTAVWSDLNLWDANYAKAIALLHEALAIDPDSVVSLINLGAALSDIGKHRQALDVLRRAKTIGSDDRNLYFNIGVAMMNISASTRGRAGTFFKKAGDLKPSPHTLEAYFDAHGH